MLCRCHVLIFTQYCSSLHISNPLRFTFVNSLHHIVWFCLHSLSRSLCKILVYFLCKHYISMIDFSSLNSCGQMSVMLMFHNISVIQDIKICSSIVADIMTFSRLPAVMYFSNLGPIVTRLISCARCTACLPQLKYLLLIVFRTWKLEKPESDAATH